MNFAGKQVLVVGGSSGIGNATARAFKAAGADVMVTGTRASPAEYGPEQAVDFEGLAYSRLDVSNSAMLADWDPGLTRLDVMVLSQGSVEYGRREFEPETFRRIVEINLNSQIDCATKLKPLLSDSEGSIITISSVGDCARPSPTRLMRPPRRGGHPFDPRIGCGLGPRRNSR
ncbi:SDR family NAD(P)-dependent oxidoreductase [Novosphingobium colocasiae]